MSFNVGDKVTYMRTVAVVEEPGPVICILRKRNGERVIGFTKLLREAG